MNPIIKKIDNVKYIWDSTALSGKGYWYVLGKNGGLGMAASKKDAEKMGRPVVDETIPESPEVYDSDDESNPHYHGPMSYQHAHALRSHGLLNNVARRLVHGESLGESVKSGLSETMKGYAVGLKEMFDPMNIAKVLTGGSAIAPALVGHLTGRSQEDMEFFTHMYGRRKKTPYYKAIGSAGKRIGNLDTAKYTSISEGRGQRIRRGDGVANVLARMLNLMKEYHEIEMKEHEEDRKEAQLRQQEKETWGKSFIAGVAAGNKDNDPNSPNNKHKDSPWTTIGKSILGLVGAGVAYKYGPKLYKAGKEKWRKSREAKKASKMPKEEPVKKTARKVPKRAANNKIRNPKFTKKFEPKQIEKIGEKEVERIAEKTIGEKSAGFAAKTILKKIPLVGLVIGLGLAANRASAGDFEGAGAEALSGAASTIPGAGTAASIGIDVSNTIHEEKFDREHPKGIKYHAMDTNLIRRNKEISKIGSAGRGRGAPALKSTGQPSVPTHRGMPTLKPLPPEANKVTQRAQAAIKENMKVEENTTNTTTSKPVVIDASKTINTGVKKEETSYSGPFHVRTEDKTLLKVQKDNLRKV